VTTVSVLQGNRAFNKLARTFACQIQALKAYRSSRQQHVTVTHLNVAARLAQVNFGALHREVIGSSPLEYPEGALRYQSIFVCVFALKCKRS
jgi:hypothetical protein